MTRFRSERPACRLCGSTRTTLGDAGIGEDYSVLQCANAFRCGQRAERRRIARAVEALPDPAEGYGESLYVKRADVLAIVRGRRG